MSAGPATNGFGPAGLGASNGAASAGLDLSGYAAGFAQPAASFAPPAVSPQPSGTNGAMLEALSALLAGTPPAPSPLGPASLTTAASALGVIGPPAGLAPIGTSASQPNLGALQPASLLQHHMPSCPVTPVGTPGAGAAPVMRRSISGGLRAGRLACQPCWRLLSVWPCAAVDHACSLPRPLPVASPADHSDPGTPGGSTKRLPIFEQLIPEAARPASAGTAPAAGPAAARRQSRLSLDDCSPGLPSSAAPAACL